jgi:hypothetical protein
MKALRKYSLAGQKERLGVVCRAAAGGIHPETTQREVMGEQTEEDCCFRGVVGLVEGVAFLDFFRLEVCLAQTQALARACGRVRILYIWRWGRSINL